MTALGWIITGSASAALLILLWPSRESQSVIALGTASVLRGGRPAAALRWTAGLAAAMFTARTAGWGLGAAVLALYWITAASLTIRARSRKRVNFSEQMARFTAVLANQVSVSSTVGEALDRSASLAAGKAGLAVKRLSAGFRSGYNAEAARGFAAEIPTASAVWAADILMVTHTRGGGALGVLGVLENLTSVEVETDRNFHRKVAARLIPVVTAAVFSAAVVAVAALVLDTYRLWLISPAGQMIVLAASAVAALTFTPPLRAAFAQVKR